MGKIKTFDQFTNLDVIKEDVEIAQPRVKPTTTPTTTPKTPVRKSPYRKDKPSVVPKPKATAKDVSERFLQLTKNNKDVQSLLKRKYNKQ